MTEMAYKRLNVCNALVQCEVDDTSMDLFAIQLRIHKSDFLWLTEDKWPIFCVTLHFTTNMTYHWAMEEHAISKGRDAFLHDLKVIADIR